MAVVRRYNTPGYLPASAAHRVEVEGEAVQVFALNETAFAQFATGGPVEVCVRVAHDITGAEVKPSRLGVDEAVQGGCLRFTLHGPANVCVEIDGVAPLFLYVDPLEAPGVPDRDDPAVTWFEAGWVHEVGVMRIASGQTLYLEPGAVVSGAFHLHGAEDVRILGAGILDGGWYATPGKPRYKLIQLDACRRVEVRDLVMTRPPTWMLLICNCEDVRVVGVRQIGEPVGSDGVDIVGSRRVRIERCFLRNNDDCVAVKACCPVYPGFADLEGRFDVADVVVESCAFWNARAGNAMEIGFETIADSISGVTFRDIDVLAAHGDGAVFSIHAGDRATISGVLFDDIRVEHMYSRCVDLMILDSRWSRDPVRGRVRGVTFRDVRTLPDIYNTLNLIGGYDAEHTVEGVSFERFRIGDRLVRNADDMTLLTRHAQGVSFHP